MLNRKKTGQLNYTSHNTVAVTHTLDVQGNHDSQHNCMLGILATDFRSPRPCSMKATWAPQWAVRPTWSSAAHSCEADSGLLEISTPGAASTARGCQTTSIIQCQPEVAAGAQRAPRPCFSGARYSCFNHRGRFTYNSLGARVSDGDGIYYICRFCCFVYRQVSTSSN